MEKNLVTLPETLQAATEALIENMLAAEPFVLYDRAQIQLNADSQATGLLAQLSALQGGIRSKQLNGGVSQKEVDELRALQRRVQQNLVIMEFAQAQQAAIQYIRAINQEISQLIGMDFASLSRQNCC